MREREPEPTEDIHLSFEQLKLLVAQHIYEHEGAIAELQGLVAQAEFGYDNNFRVDIFLSGEDGMVHVELEKKPPIGFRTSH